MDNNTHIVINIVSIMSIFSIFGLLLVGCSSQDNQKNTGINNDSLSFTVNNSDNNNNQENSINDTEPVIKKIKPKLSANLLGPRLGEIPFTDTWTCNITAENAGYTIVWAVATVEQIEKADLNIRMSEQFEYTACRGKKECSLTFNMPAVYSIGCIVENTTLGLTSVGQHYINITKLQKKVSNIIALGDSLTYGETLENPRDDSWVSLLNNGFENSTLFNYAVTGFTTTDVLNNELPRLKNDTELRDFSSETFIFVWIGANDLRIFTDINTFTANYHSIINQVGMIQNATNATVFLMTIPDVSKLNAAANAEEQVNNALQRYGLNVQINLREIGAEVIAQYNAIIINESSAINCTIIDTYSAMKLLNESDISSDGFHPNKAGHEKVYGLVKEKISEAYPMVEFR